jgi:hypothetical protein
MRGCRIEPDLGFFGGDLVAAHLARVRGALQEKPRGDLHQPRRQPHRFGGVKRRRQARQLLRLGAALAVEIFGRMFDQAHAFVVERLERLRENATLGEPDRVGAFLGRFAHS